MTEEELRKLAGQVKAEIERAERKFAELVQKEKEIIAAIKAAEGAKKALKNARLRIMKTVTDNQAAFDNSPLKGAIDEILSAIKDI